MLLFVKLSSIEKLLPGDQIIRINGEDVKKAPREYVIDCVRYIYYPSVSVSLEYFYFSDTCTFICFAVGGI
jgi:hypothetical protein